MRKLIKFIADLLLLLLLVMVGAITAPKLLKIQPLTVLSGSMEPAYHVGSLVYVKETDVNTIAVGDTITYHLTDDTLVTHRVVAKDEEAQTFTTKGDANQVEDGSPVSYSKVAGKVMFSIPYLGYAATFLSTKSGFIVLISVVIALIILSFIPDLIGNEKAEGKKHENESIQ